MRKSMRKAAAASLAAITLAAAPTASFAAGGHGGGPGGFGGGAFPAAGGVSQGGFSGSFHGSIGGLTPGVAPSFGGFHAPGPSSLGGFHAPRPAPFGGFHPTGPTNLGGFPFHPPLGPHFDGTTLNSGVFPRRPLPPPFHPAPPIVVSPTWGAHPHSVGRHRRRGGGVVVYPGFPSYCVSGVLDCDNSYYYDSSNCWVKRRVFDSRGYFAGWRRDYVCQDNQ